MSYIPLIESTNSFKAFTHPDEDDKHLYLEGVVIEVDKPNANKRIYPKMVFENALENYSKMICDRRAFGELDHPLENVHKISPNRISHIFESIKKVGNKFIAKIRILDTPSGNIVKGIVESGGRLGVSLRALGETESKGKYRIVKSLSIITAGDIVLDPSNMRMMDPIYEESEYVFEDNQFRKIEKYKVPITLFTQDIEYKEETLEYRDWKQIYFERI